MSDNIPILGGILAPRVPDPTPAPPPPTRRSPEIAAAAEKQRQADARRKSRASTIIAGDVPADPTVTRPAARDGAQLLGQV